MARPAQPVQAIVTHVQVVVFVKLVNQDMDYKAINATPAPRELICLAKRAQYAQATVIHVQAVLSVKLVKQDMVYKVTNAILALLELIS